MEDSGTIHYEKGCVEVGKRCLIVSVGSIVDERILLVKLSPKPDEEGEDLSLVSQPWRPSLREVIGQDVLVDSPACQGEVGGPDLHNLGRTVVSAQNLSVAEVRLGVGGDNDLAVFRYCYRDGHAVFLGYRFLSKSCLMCRLPRLEAINRSAIRSSI